MQHQKCTVPARRVAVLTVQQLQRLDEEEASYLMAVRAQDQTIDLACRLAQAFARMVRERQGARPDAWIADTQASGIDELARFASDLLTDEAAPLDRKSTVPSTVRRDIASHLPQIAACDLIRSKAD